MHCRSQKANWKIKPNLMRKKKSFSHTCTSSFFPQFMRRRSLDNPLWIVNAKKTNKNDKKKKFYTHSTFKHEPHGRAAIQTHMYGWFSWGRSKAVWMLVVVGRLRSNVCLCKNSSLRESNDCRHNRGLNKFTLFFYYNFFYCDPTETTEQ